MTTKTTPLDHVWEIATKIRTCMLTTLPANRMRSRPMHAIIDRSAGCLWFITEQRGTKDEEIGGAPDVCLAFAATGSNTYVSPGAPRYCTMPPRSGNCGAPKRKRGGRKVRPTPRSVYFVWSRIALNTGYAREFNHSRVETRSGALLRPPSGSGGKQEGALTLTALRARHDVRACNRLQVESSCLQI